MLGSAAVKELWDSSFTRHDEPDCVTSWLHLFALQLVELVCSLLFDFLALSLVPLYIYIFNTQVVTPFFGHNKDFLCVCVSCFQLSY